MSKDRRLTLVLLLDLLLIVALVIVGLAAHSLGLLAAGVDYLGDDADVEGQQRSGVDQCRNVGRVWVSAQVIANRSMRESDGE